MEWLTSKKWVKYTDALSEMDSRVAGIKNGSQTEAIWLLEHDNLYTAGTSAKESDLLNAKFPVHKAGRGGEYTYHGPGQRVAYVMLDLKKRQNVPDIKRYVWQLEEWIIRSLSEFDVKAERREGRVGIWVVTENGLEKKIAAIGVRVRHWITFHGVSINVAPNLDNFNGIVPCGLAQYGVTSLSEIIGNNASMEKLDLALKKHFCDVFSD